MLISICYPSGENVKATFVKSLLDLLIVNRLPVCVSNSQSSRIALNRNILVHGAIAQKASHVLFIDADMTFPSNSLLRLFAHDLPIVGATASRRWADTDAIGTTLDGSRLRFPSPLVKMKLLGLPFMLIKMEVFEKIPAPWFAEPPKEDGSLTAEDEYFCDKAIAHGYDVWCDPNLSMEVGHYGSYEFKIKVVKE